MACMSMDLDDGVNEGKRKAKFKQKCPFCNR